MYRIGFTVYLELIWTVNSNDDIWIVNGTKMKPATSHFNISGEAMSFYKPQRLDCY